jgi:hypothetical protein
MCFLVIQTFKILIHAIAKGRNALFVAFWQNEFVEVA